MAKPKFEIAMKKVRTPSQIGKLSRNKGAAEERRVAKLYEFALCTKVQRDISQYQQSSGRDLRGCQPWCVQNKVGKKVNARSAYLEAANAVDNEYSIAVAHIRNDNEEPLVVISEQDFMVIVERLTTAGV